MNKCFALRREAGRGARIPAGWRMAWYEPRRRVGIYYPAPLHWIARHLRDFSYRVGLALRAPGIECSQVFELQHQYRQRQRLADEYSRGYMSGWRECFTECLQAIESELSRSDEAWDVGALLTGKPKPSRPEN